MAFFNRDNYMYCINEHEWEKDFSNKYDKMVKYTETLKITLQAFAVVFVWKLFWRNTM